MESTSHQVNMHEAKTRLSELVARAERGEEVIIARNGKPVAKLTPVNGDRPKPRVFGRDRGKFTVPENFNEPDPEIEAMFYGEDSD